MAIGCASCANASGFRNRKSRSRQRSAPPITLRSGARVVARFFLEPVQDDVERPTYEILYGLLDQNIIGDLVLITRTRNRLIPRHALIQSAAASPVGFSEGREPMPRRDGVIEYRQSADDPAEILGLVVYAMGPA